MVFAPPIQTKRLPTPSVSRQMPCDFVRDQGLLYDGDNVVGDIQGGSISKFYVTPFLDQNLSMTVVGGPQAGIYYYSQDGLGSVRTLTDSSANLMNHYDHDAFGVPQAVTTSETVSQRYTYTGQEREPTSGLMYYNYRHYFPGVGRFGKRDPVGYWNNRFGNLYGYVDNSTAVFNDPYGLDKMFRWCCEEEMPDGTARYYTQEVKLTRDHIDNDTGKVDNVGELSRIGLQDRASEMWSLRSYPSGGGKANWDYRGDILEAHLNICNTSAGKINLFKNRQKSAISKMAKFEDTAPLTTKFLHDQGLGSAGNTSTGANEELITKYGEAVYIVVDQFEHDPNAPEEEASAIRSAWGESTLGATNETQNLQKAMMLERKRAQRFMNEWFSVVDKIFNAPKKYVCSCDHDDRGKSPDASNCGY